MNTFRCSNCGFQIQRPTQPFSCPQCGRQAVGLFRVVGFTPPQQGGWPGQPAAPQQPYPQAGVQPQQPGWPQQPGAMPQQGMPQQGVQPPAQGAWPGQPQVPQAPVNPWGQPYPQAGVQPQSPAAGWPGQAGMQQPPQPVIPQQGGWPTPGPQPPMPPWGQPPTAPQMPQQPAAGGWPGQTGIPQQPIPQQPYPQAGSQPPAPQGWPGGMQQPPAGQWPQQGAAPTFPGQPAMPAPPSMGPPGIPPQQFPPRYPQPPAPPAMTQPPTSQPPPQGQPPRKPPASPSSPQNVAPGRTAFPPPPGAVKRPARPAAPKPPTAGKGDSPTFADTKVGTVPSPASRQAPPPERKPPPADRPPQAPAQAVPPTAPPTPASRPAEARPSSTVAPLPRELAAEAKPPAPSKAAEVKVLPPLRPAVAPKPVQRPKKPRPERLVWSFPDDLVPEEQAIPLRNAPAVDSGGRVFLQYRDRLVALIEEEKKPKLLWEYVIGTRAPGPVVLGPQDTVRLHCCDGFLHCLDALTGKQVWSPAGVGEPLGYAVPVADRDGSTLVCAPEGGLARVDSQGRVQKPQFFRSRKKLDSPAVLLDGVLYVGSELGYMFAIDVAGERGVSKWTHAGDHAYVGVVRSAPIVTPEKVLIVAGQDECLYGVATSGAVVWKTQLQGQILGSPVADRNGHLYLGLSQVPRGLEPRGALACLDGNSHKVRWEYRTEAPVESTPVIGDDDLIYFGDNAGVIHAVDFSGKAQWTADVDSPVRSAGTFVAPHRLAFGLDNDSLVVLDCSSNGLAAEGWPKFGRTLGQNGVV